MLFAIRLHWVSAGGFPGWHAGFAAGVKALTLPALALAMPQRRHPGPRAARLAGRYPAHEDYIRTARAKGRGGMAGAFGATPCPTTLIPVLTIMGMQFSFLLARTA